MIILLGQTVPVHIVSTPSLATLAAYMSFFVIDSSYRSTKLFNINWRCALIVILLIKDFLNSLDAIVVVDKIVC